MKLVIVKDYDAMSLAAAEEVVMALQANPYLRLGLATGGTPEGMYRELVHATKVKNLDWSNVVTFNLDEYVGIDRHHPLSYATYMHEKFFDHVNLKRKHIHLPKGTGNLDRNIAKFNKALEKSGGIDLQILGIGENAHIAFNEPGSSKDDGVRVVELTPSTIEANARYFSTPDAVPRTAITMGIGTILKARRIILLASGAKKAEAIRKTWESPVTSEVPSSFLQLHNDVTFIIDEEAASHLQKPGAKPAATFENMVMPEARPSKKPRAAAKPKPAQPKPPAMAKPMPTKPAPKAAKPAPTKPAAAKTATNTARKAAPKPTISKAKPAPAMATKAPAMSKAKKSSTSRPATKPSTPAKNTKAAPTVKKVAATTKSNKTKAAPATPTKTKKPVAKAETKLGARRK